VLHDDLERRRRDELPAADLVAQAGELQEKHVEPARRHPVEL
jgi:hypothetical protein